MSALLSDPSAVRIRRGGVLAFVDRFECGELVGEAVLVRADGR